jgi:predicted SnoaL-like aldol condensation-catalyzing enzyme
MTSQPDNKAIVREFYDIAFNQKRPLEAVADYIGDNYLQHDPMSGDGPGSFIAFANGVAEAFPEGRTEFKRFIADGDLVAVHSHFIRAPGDRGMALVDIFRVDNGKIVEHWSVMQAVPDTAANLNTMF